MAKHNQGEVFKDTKERLSKRTGIKGKQFENMKFALVPKSMYARPSYINDGKSTVHASIVATPLTIDR